VPSAPKAIPAASAAADPPLDPPADRDSSSGFLTGPNADSSLVVPNAKRAPAQHRDEGVDRRPCLDRRETSCDEIHRRNHAGAHQRRHLADRPQVRHLSVL